MLGDVGDCDISEKSSPKVEQLVITPFDEGIHVTWAIITLDSVIIYYHIRPSVRCVPMIYLKLESHKNFIFDGDITPVMSNWGSKF